MTTSLTHFKERPHTNLGWWAVWLMAAFVVMFFINAFVFMAFPSLGDGAWRQTVLPFYGVAMLLCGLVSGAVGLVAITYQHDRSWLVWLTILPMAWVVFMLIGELIVPLIFPELAH
jgi:hypothetical protein